MPAKIPRPIGSTEIFFPGIWKADSAVALEDAVEEALSATVTAPAIPLLVADAVDLGGGAAVVDGKGVDEVVDGGVGDEVSVPVGSGTVETP